MAANDSPWAQYNRDLRRWARVTETQLKGNVSVRTGKLRDEIGVKTYNDSIDGRLEAIRFLFARHGVFLEIGVGVDRPPNSAAAQKAAKPWLRPVLDARRAELERIVAETSADALAQVMENLIPLQIKFVMR